MHTWGIAAVGCFDTLTKTTTSNSSIDQCPPATILNYIFLTGFVWYTKEKMGYRQLINEKNGEWKPFLPKINN